MIGVNAILSKAYRLAKSNHVCEAQHYNRIITYAVKDLMHTYICCLEVISKSGRQARGARQETHRLLKPGGISCRTSFYKRRLLFHEVTDMGRAMKRSLQQAEPL